jgi:hypothetical protein
VFVLLPEERAKWVEYAGKAGTRDPRHFRAMSADLDNLASWHVLDSRIDNLLIEKPSAAGESRGHGLAPAFIESAPQERHRPWRLFLLFSRYSIKTDQTMWVFLQKGSAIVYPRRSTPRQDWWPAWLGDIFGVSGRFGCSQRHYRAKRKRRTRGVASCLWRQTEKSAQT